MTKKLQFGDEVKPTANYADNKKRKFIFMGYMGGELSGYARIATVHENGMGHCEDGEWKKGHGFVLECDSFVHKKYLEKK